MLMPSLFSSSAYFKQVNFNLMLFATGFMTFSLFVPPFYLPSYAVTAGL